MEALIRPVTPDDAEDLHAIYGPYVRSTSVSFEVDEPSVLEMRQRIQTVSAQYPWIVALLPEGIVGYAYASKHRERAAYQWSVEVSVYIAESHQGRGLGTRLSMVLLKILGDLGYFNAYAGITLPNPRSVALHEGMGFLKIGVFAKVGYKLGSWHDVGWWQRRLRDEDAPKGKPLDFPAWLRSRSKKELIGDCDRLGTNGPVRDREE